jgi:hypothetical protein
LGVDGEIGSVKAGAETISVVKVNVKVGREVDAKVRIKVGAEVRMATAGKIGRTRTGLIIRVFKRFKVKVRSFGKS